jgi:hypothetical protein
MLCVAAACRDCGSGGVTRTASGLLQGLGMALPSEKCPVCSEDAKIISPAISRNELAARTAERTSSKTACYGMCWRSAIQTPRPNSLTRFVVHTTTVARCQSTEVWWNHTTDSLFHRPNNSIDSSFGWVRISTSTGMQSNLMAPRSGRRSVRGRRRPFPPWSGGPLSRGLLLPRATHKPSDSPSLGGRGSRISTLAAFRSLAPSWRCLTVIPTLIAHTGNASSPPPRAQGSIFSELTKTQRPQGVCLTGPQTSPEKQNEQDEVRHRLVLGLHEERIALRAAHRPDAPLPLAVVTASTRLRPRRRPSCRTGLVSMIPSSTAALSIVDSVSPVITRLSATAPLPSVAGRSLPLGTIVRLSGHSRALVHQTPPSKVVVPSRGLGASRRRRSARAGLRGEQLDDAGKVRSVDATVLIAVGEAAAQLDAAVEDRG